MSCKNPSDYIQMRTYSKELIMSLCSLLFLPKIEYALLLLEDHLIETSVMRARENIAFVYFLLLSLYQNNRQILLHYF